MKTSDPEPGDREVASVGKPMQDTEVSAQAKGMLWGLFEASTRNSWQHRALCAQTDPEAFFPEKGGSTRDAKAVCSHCEVRQQCLTWAIEHDERFGIWGGLSERERRKYKHEHGFIRARKRA